MRCIINKTEFITSAVRSTRWRSWLRHCATSRKVADSIHCHWNCSLWPWGRLSL